MTCLNRPSSHCGVVQSQGPVLMSVVTFEVMAFPNWRHSPGWATGFGLRRAQLLTLNPTPFHFSTLKS